MTTPTIKSSLPDGTILGQHATQDAADFTAERPLTQRVVVMVVQAGGTAYKDLDKGRSVKVQYTALHAVEVTDEHEADRLRHLLAETRAGRGLSVRQPPLWDSPDDDSDERRAEVLGYLSEWQLEQDPVVGDEQLEERWQSFHGGNYDARLSKGAPLHLREFAISVGALADSGGPDDVDDSEPDPDAHRDDDDEPEALTLEEQADALLAAEPDDDGDPDLKPAVAVVPEPGFTDQP